MYNREFNIAAYIADYLNGDLDPGRAHELDLWLSESKTNRLLFKELIDEKKTVAKLKQYRDADTAPVWEKTMALVNLVEGTRRSRHVRLSWRLMSGIAAAVAIIILSIVIYSQNFFQDDLLVSGRQARVLPGKNQAVLTLASGKKIALNSVKNGLLTAQSGVVLTKTASGEIIYTVSANQTANPNEYNSVETPKGGQFHVNLPDGTKVALNAASSIRFSPALSELGQRRIELKGEAYFEVAKDPSRPFIVKTANQEIEVLGTHFNVNAYADEQQVTTTLLEGSVKINQHTYLKPGEKSILSSSGIQVSKANIEMETAWKNGRFAFTGKDFKSLMRTIARWYDVELVYEYDPGDLHIAGGISRYENIRDVLELIQETGDVKFKIERRRIYIMK